MRTRAVLTESTRSLWASIHRVVHVLGSRALDSGSRSLGKARVYTDIPPSQWEDTGKGTGDAGHGTYAPLISAGTVSPRNFPSVERQQSSLGQTDRTWLQVWSHTLFSPAPYCLLPSYGPGRSQADREEDRRLQGQLPQKDHQGSTLSCGPGCF